MGPWAQIFNFIGHEVGASVGKKIASSARKSKDVLLDGSVFRWTHKDKIAELAKDSGLSPSYVKELANESTSKEDIGAVLEYLSTTKASNIEWGTRLEIKEKLWQKLKMLEDQEALREIIKAYKEKGLSFAEHILDYLA